MGWFHLIRSVNTTFGSHKGNLKGERENSSGSPLPTLQKFQTFGKGETVMSNLLNTTDCFVINTGLTDNLSKQICESVIGQLSDGIWENSRQMHNYWPFIEIDVIDGNVCLVIDKRKSRGVYDSRKNKMIVTYYNYFVYFSKLNGDTEKIKKWFASKLKAVVNEEKKDCPNRGIAFNSTCDKVLDYLGYSDQVTVKDAYKVYKALTSTH